MFCKKCGRQIDDDSKFCEFCGQAVGINVEREDYSGGKWKEILFSPVTIFIVFFTLLFGGAFANEMRMNHQTKEGLIGCWEVIEREPFAYEKIIFQKNGIYRAYTFAHDKTPSSRGPYKIAKGEVTFDNIETEGRIVSKGSDIIVEGPAIAGNIYAVDRCLIREDGSLVIWYNSRYLGDSGTPVRYEFSMENFD